MLKLLGERKCNCDSIVFGNKYIASNMYIIFSKNVCKNRGGEDIEHEDKTEKRRMRQKIRAMGNGKITTRFLWHCQVLDSPKKLCYLIH